MKNISKKSLIFSAVLSFAILLSACQPVSTPTALPAKTPTSGIHSQTHPCQLGNLNPIPYSSMVVGGTSEMSGGFINCTTFACYLQSWLDFSLVDAAGNPLDS